MHSSLAVTEAGLPLGLAAVKFWTRQEFKGCNELKRRVNPTRIPIGQKESVRWVDNLVDTTALLSEPMRCVHIGDRAADIYELFCAANDVGTHFVVRSAVSRLAEDGRAKTDREMQEVRIQGLHRIEVRDRNGDLVEAELELKYRRMLVLPPVAKAKDYGPLVRSRQDALEKLKWYAMRWKIEVFHKILKSGCKVEESRLRTAPRLVNLIATCCVLAWRIFWMTMINRTQPSAAPTVALTQMELELLDRLKADKAATNPTDKTLSHYLTKIARLGGYLDRASDPPPGNIVMWRGLARLTDITLGFSLHAEKCG